MRLRRKQKSRFSEIELEESRKKREQLIKDGSSMKRLMENDDFKRFCDLLKMDAENLNHFLLSESVNMGDRMTTDLVRVRLIARINQIDRCVSKPRSICWQVKNLTEVRDTIKAQNHERQALVK